MDRRRSNAKQIFADSQEVIPGGVNSPARAFRDLSMTPMIVHSGAGDTLTDVDGHRYIDYCGSWGALILGHAHPKVVKASCRQIELGSSFGIATEVELQLAAEVVKLFPSIEKIRFVSSGTEATMTAIRLARGFTGKPIIVKFNGHYHGHSDSLLIKAGSGVAHLPEASSRGVLEENVKYTVSLPYNDFSAVRNFLESSDRIAAVLLEPITGNMGVIAPKPGFLEMLREECSKRGILLIFDEVITGFRVGLRGAQEKYGIVPDLTCLGKIIGGGFPAAAFGGKSEIMDLLAPLGPVYQAGTLSGNPVAMQAGLTTLREIQKEGFYQELQRKCDLLLLPIQDFIEKSEMPIVLHREGSMFSFFFGIKEVHSFEDLVDLDRSMFREFFFDLFEKGVYLSPSPFEASFVSIAHTDENLRSTQELILSWLQERALSIRSGICSRS